jgi:hypothetical protein
MRMLHMMLDIGLVKLRKEVEPEQPKKNSIAKIIASPYRLSVLMINKISGK